MLQEITVHKDARILQVAHDNSVRYFVTFEHSISTSLAIETLGVIKGVASKDLVKFAIDNVVLEFHRNRCATLRVSGDDCAYRLKLLY